MDWLTFISKLIDSLAWPGSILLIGLLFRREIRPLITSVRKFSWGDKVLEFDRRLEAAEEHATVLEAKVEPQLKLAPPAPEPTPEFDQALNVSPKLAVVESWLPVEQKLHELGVEHGYVSGQGRSLTYLLRRLATDGVIDKNTERLINELKHMRNIALHPTQTEISPEDARRYRELAQTVLSVLSNLNLH